MTLHRIPHSRLPYGSVLPLSESREARTETETVQIVAKCPPCARVLGFEVVESREDVGHYRVECPNRGCKRDADVSS